MTQLAVPFHASDSLRIYLADSFPIPVCQNIRIKRCEMYQNHGTHADVTALYDFCFQVDTGSLIYGDWAYDAYAIEDELDRSSIAINPVRKKNSKRKYDSFIEDGIKLVRKRIESVFSVIKQ